MRYPISRCFSTAPGRHRTVWKNRTIPYCVNYKHASKLKAPEFDSATAKNKNKRSWSKRTHCRRHPRRHLGARVSSLSATTPPSGMETHVCKQNSGGLLYATCRWPCVTWTCSLSGIAHTFPIGDGLEKSMFTYLQGDTVEMHLLHTNESFTISASG